MEFSQNDIDRLMLSEHNRITAEQNYAKNPHDADNLTKWGEALIELSSTVQNPRDSKKMMKDAISKLEDALLVDPTKHYTLWCLGNANISSGFLTPDVSDAKVYFDTAFQNFKKAVDLDPENGLYTQSLKLALKAPELHMEIQKNESGFRQMSREGSSASSKEQVAKKQSNDFKYDIVGWVILAAGIAAWVVMAKSHVPPSPPS